MKLTSLFVIALLFAMVPACESMGGTDAVAGLGGVDINQILSGITDAASAEEAKGPLDGAVAMLKDALAGAKSEAQEATAGGGGNMIADIAAKFGISAETTKMITGLLDNPAIAGVIGPTLQQLQGLLPAM